ncbi:aromatic ring-hydroxylating dioxygenase subunit alpha [Sphingomonas populi]|uniref:Aromatic ring-hydroxylating dioxygenase subunit alpha n=1 Tax=Sphingomonas populi TaxID=2484750 RepID=A0A4V2DD62_9SPHN|nr:aromatic ring-hydroxylating dioxygenase subunit alpha [Sphingomonas populi]RZF63878.1 aromatic ring-hydroxylating dioxygenase subunit alpha [Sphingomonas populi]
MIEGTAFLELLERQRAGWTLEQPFYLDEDIFAFERDRWMSRQWMLMAHIAELPAKGSHIVRDLFNESIVIARAGDDDVRAYFNVCTHRGSRLCKADGRAPLLVCPYHAWSFKLTGELQSRADVPDGIDPADLGLHPVSVHLVEGLIFCALPSDALPDPAPAFDVLGPALRQHGIKRARIAARKSYPTNANWKLVLENAFECYHCRNAHPEYTNVNGHVQVTGMRDAAKAETWADEIAHWQKTITGADGFDMKHRDPGSLDRLSYSVTRHPIGRGRATLSRDGAPVSKLMGAFADYDGGETQFRFGRLSFASAANDHVTLVQIQPRSAQQTDMVLTWLVDADADPALDVEPIQWMWDVTTVQDKRIIEDNAAGIRSRAYRPGPYTALEGETATFVQSYRAEMHALVCDDAGVGG